MQIYSPYNIYTSISLSRYNDDTSEVDNTPFNSSLSFDEENREPIKKNWQTAPSRIPFFLSRALNNIHFQSLERISIDFPATKRRNNSPSSIIDDAFSTSFPIFVTNVAHARNLEYLHFNASRIMTNERSGMLESLYEIFSDNLSCCKKLKDLDIFNIGYIRGYDNPFYSVSLLLAIMPAIKRNKLNRLRIVLAGQPSDPLYDRFLTSNDQHVVYNFFDAALSADNLSSLEISMSRSASHLGALISATRLRLEDRKLLRNLKHLFLSYALSDDEYSEDLNLLPAAPILECFSKCQFLQSIHLELPSRNWEGEENTHALMKLLENKPLLSSFIISFSNFSSKISRRMLGIISDGLVQNIANKTLHKVSIYRLPEVNEEDLLHFNDNMRNAGLICTCFRAINKAPGRWLVMAMINRKLAEGEIIQDAFVHELKRRQKA